jgi:tetratricopeptide (TPR) repeat protein
MKHFVFTGVLLSFSSVALAQPATTDTAQAAMQSPAYQECSALANSNPAQALMKAEAWINIDNTIAAQHCRAMALFGLRRFLEAGDALANVRTMITGDNITLRSYVTRQTAKAFLNANMADRALAALNDQINANAGYRGDNAASARLTSELLLERARLHASFGKLDEAAKDLDHAVSLTPINEAVLLERAGVFEKLGDRALALSDVEAVLTLNKNNAQARSMHARLSGNPSGAIAAQPFSVMAPAAAPVATPPHRTKRKPAQVTPASQAP